MPVQPSGVNTVQPSVLKFPVLIQEVNLQGRKRKLAIALTFIMNQMYMQEAMTLECSLIPLL